MNQPGETRTRSTAVIATVFGAMAMAIIPSPAVGALGPFIIDGLTLSRSELGLAVAVFGVVGGLGAPAFGRVSDKLGGRSALRLLFALNLLALISLASATGLTMLVLAMCLAGLGQASAPSATNVAVSELLERESWGVAAGVKEAGVPAGALLAGLALPLIGSAYGWRVGIFVLALLTSALLVLTQLSLDQQRNTGLMVHDARMKLPGFVRILALYGFMIGFGANAMVVFLPLLAKESIGVPATIAGSLVAVLGFSSVLARFSWGQIAMRRHTPKLYLTAIAGVALCGLGLIAAASPTRAWLLWLGSAVIGLSAFSWTPVGVLAVLKLVPRAATGRATGRIILGFGLGLGLGPLVFGVVVDALGAYSAGFMCVAAAFLGAGLVALAARSAAFDGEGVLEW